MGVYIWNRLPSEYQEVEYIQSSGTQYINTGYVPNQKTKAEFKISNWNVPVTSPTTYSNIFGADQSYLNRGFNICSTGSSSVYAFGSTGGLINGYTGLNGSGTHIGEYSQSGLYVDGSLIVTPSTQTFTGLNLYLFALNRNGTLTEPASFRMHYFKIYESGTLVRNFIPCYRKADSVIGMYDTVNNVFYTNAGTGTFTKGNDVNTYRESSLKNAYIGEVWTPGSNTVAYWELNGNGNDTKNNYGVQTYTTTNYNATGYVGAGNPTYTTTRNGKKCAYFDGTRGLQLPELPIPSNNLTFSAWVKLISNPSATAYFFQLRSDIYAKDCSAFMFVGYNSKIYPIWIGVTTPSGRTGETAYQTNGISATFDTWYNVIATFNAGTLKFYVNGSLVDTLTGNAYLRNVAGSQSYIGVKNNPIYSEQVFLNCYVQDIIYENKVWSSTEVLEYYNKTK